MENQEQNELNLNVEEASKTKRVMKIEVPAHTIGPELQNAYRTFQKKAKLPGFRPGKVPMQMIRQRMGREVEENLMQRVIPLYYSKALEKAALEPVDMPIIRNVQLKEGEPFRFDATVYIKPSFEVKDYIGVSCSRNESQVSEEIVNKVMADMQEKVANLVSYEDVTRPVETGDIVEADFEGMIDGEPIEGGKGENRLIEIGVDKLLPELENGFLGMKKGEEKQIDVNFPDDYPAPQLAGKQACFQVNVKDVKQKKLPKLDDEFAKDLGEKYETLEELKAEVRKNLKEREDKRIREESHLEIMDEVLRCNPIEELPEIMVERHKRSLKEGMEKDLQNSGMPEAQIEKVMAEEKLEEKAERDVAWSLILEQIAAKEKIAVSPEDLEEALEKRAWEGSMTKEVLRDLYMTQMGSLEPLRLSLLNEKTLDFLLENAKVTVRERDEKKSEGEE